MLPFYKVLLKEEAMQKKSIPVNNQTSNKAMMLKKETPFYDAYFDKNSYEMFKFDVGAVCTRNAILSKVPISTGSALEIGIGISSLLEKLQQFTCTGIDISQKTIETTEHLFKAHQLQGSFIQTDAASLPFTDDSFDVIVTSHVFEHIEDDGKAFKEVARVLKPGGTFIMFVPGSLDGKAPQEEWEKCGHYRNYNKAEILRLQKASSDTLLLQSIEYKHKIHNLIWNKCKHIVRYINYPIKKWLLRDNKDVESRKTYQRFFLPALSVSLDYLDKLTHHKEAYLLGTKFNVLAVFKKIITDAKSKEI